MQNPYERKVLAIHTTHSTLSQLPYTQPVAILPLQHFTDSNTRMQYTHSTYSALFFFRFFAFSLGFQTGHSLEQQVISLHEDQELQHILCIAKSAFPLFIQREISQLCPEHDSMHEVLQNNIHHYLKLYHHNDLTSKIYHK